jgi:tetratricopeptide (TPR) repeat protein
MNRASLIARISTLAFSLCLLGGWAGAQVDQLPPSDKGPAPSQEPPRYEPERGPGVSSSRDTKIDITPPKDDAKSHPNSTSAVADAENEASSDVQELHPWDPHKAAKDVEVGDFYFRRKNYRASLDRYREALLYKPDDATANFRMAESFEKLDDPDEAAAHYQEYLKILPRGPLSASAEKALARLKAEKARTASTDPAKQ